jgi:hypothetical protein
VINGDVERMKVAIADFTALQTSKRVFRHGKLFNTFRGLRFLFNSDGAAVLKNEIIFKLHLIWSSICTGETNCINKI